MQVQTNNNAMRKHILIFAVILVTSLASKAQVNFSARVFDPTGKQLYDCFCFSLRVECEDTIRFHNWCDTSTITHFNNIPIGSRCHFIYSELGGKMYDYPVFTINSDMYIDSMVLKQYLKLRVYLPTNADSALSVWTKNIDGCDTIWNESSDHYDVWTDNPNYLKLARLYYNDWINPFPSWRRWQHSADSAYKYCLYAYKKHQYFYYPLRQLAYHLGIEFSGKAPKKPNKDVFILQPPMSEEWWKDSTTNLLYLWEEHSIDNSYHKKFMKKAKEKSLCYPVGDNGIARLIIMNPLGGNRIYRLQNGKLHFKYLRIFKPKLLINESYKLTSMESDSVTSLINTFSHITRNNDDSGFYVIDGSTYLLEYIIDGKYYYYKTSSGAEPKELIDILEYFGALNKKYGSR